MAQLLSLPVVGRQEEGTCDPGCGPLPSPGPGLFPGLLCDSMGRSRLAVPAALVQVWGGGIGWQQWAFLGPVWGGMWASGRELRLGLPRLLLGRSHTPAPPGRACL